MLVLAPVFCANRLRACRRAHLGNQLVYAAQPFDRSPPSPSFVKVRRQTVILLATVMSCLCRDLHKPLGFFDLLHLILHLRQLPVELLVHVGEVAVDLLKSRVQNRQRPQGPLRLPVQVQDFVVSLRLTCSGRPFFPIEDFLEFPEVSAVDAEASYSIPTRGAETDLLFLSGTLGASH